MRYGGLQRSGVGPSLSSSRACLHTAIIAFSVLCMFDIAIVRFGVNSLVVAPSGLFTKMNFFQSINRTTSHPSRNVAVDCCQRTAELPDFVAKQPRPPL